MMTEIKFAIAISANDLPGGPEIARGNMDGTWWIDWDAVHRFIDKNEENPRQRAQVMLFKLLIAARGSYTEVTRERCEEVALEAGREASAKETPNASTP